MGTVGRRRGGRETWGESGMGWPRPHRRGIPPAGGPQSRRRTMKPDRNSKRLPCPKRSNLLTTPGQPFEDVAQFAAKNR